ncbi:hypothetical protein [Chelativorans sp. AA-79]|uniref:A1S_2505 family phage non-structural protein n=1 Tax=Chelativorans sp. AA-79 TaxID=3028735 RepID=UPI0023F6AE55|nr:hypothetical protein [Chelativorans sp. AA-79]WEX09164.1 hypothetical protein PVE73_24545 [Chelativorans sp. AA-79]
MPVPSSPTSVFVFGSNLAGRHGKGAALWARHHRGAIYGRGVGPQGDAYAIPTKDRHLRVLPLPVIRSHVADFLGYARHRPDLRFEVTPIGCGLAGYRPDQIAPMFAGAPANVFLPDAFRVVLSASSGEVRHG